MYEFMLLENGATSCVCGVHVVYLWYVYDMCCVWCVCMVSV